MSSSGCYDHAYFTNGYPTTSKNFNLGNRWKVAHVSFMAQEWHPIPVGQPGMRRSMGTVACRTIITPIHQLTRTIFESQRDTIEDQLLVSPTRNGQISIFHCGRS